MENKDEEIQIVEIDNNEDYILDLDVEDTENKEIDYSEFYADDVPDKKRRKFIPVIIICVVLATLALAAVAFIVERNRPSKKYTDLYAYYGIEQDMMAVVLNGEIIGNTYYYEDDVYLSMDFVMENINDRFYHDAGRDMLLYTTDTQIYEIPFDSMEFTLSGGVVESEYKIAVRIGDEVYIAVDFLEDKSFYTYKVVENPKRLVIIPDDTIIASIIFTEDAKVRTEASVKAPIISDASVDEMNWYIITDVAKKGWSEVKCIDGRKGFVKIDEIMSDEVITFDSGYQGLEYISCRKDYDIVLMWHAIYNMDANAKISELLADSKGVTTVSPTWYKIANETGSIYTMADKAYVDYVHSLGMEVWPLISDFTSAEPNGWKISDLFDNTLNRRNLIDNIMSEIDNYGYDGINIDFEYIKQDSADGFIQFIRELSIKCREKQVVLSIDNYVPKAHTKHYNRKAQGECADYVIVMGYDEHYRGGGVAGSVASISFVKEGILDTLKEVPADKLINGIPFYTRLWAEKTDETGKKVLDATSYSMDAALKMVETLGLTMEWDEEVCQYVAEGLVDGVHYSIWLEEERSMAAKMELVWDNNLAGIAAWSLGMEKKEIWDVLIK